MAKPIDDDFSAFDAVMATPDTEEDFSAFDSVAQPTGITGKIGSKLEDIASGAAQFAEESSQPIIDSALGFSTGVAKGLTMNALDELGGAAGAAIETGLGKLGIGPGAVDAQLQEQGFTVPEDSFLDKYRMYQQASEQEQKKIADAAPVSDVLGQIGGGITSGALMGSALGLGKAAQGAKSIKDIAAQDGKLKAGLELLKRGGTTYAKAAPAIAAEAALTSEQQLIGDNANPEGVAADVVGGLAFGLPTVMGLTAAGEALPAVGQKADKALQGLKDAFTSEDNPRLRQLALAYNKYGRDLGVHPRSHSQDIGGLKLSQMDNKNTSLVLDTLNKADAEIGKEVGESILKATQRGALIDISPDIQNAAQRVNDLAQQIPALGQSRRSQVAYDKIFNGQGQQLTPIELKNLVDDIDASIGVFKSATNKNPAEASTLSELINFRKSISQSLKKGVPEYAQAARRFESFREVLEQLVSRDKPTEATEKFFGNLNNQQDKLFSSLRDMVENVQKTSDAAQPTRTSFTNFMEAFKKFEAEDAARMAANPNLKQVAPHSNQIRKTILEASDDSVLRGSVRNVKESGALTPDLKEFFIGKAPTSAAYMLGSLSKKVEPVVQNVAKVSKAIYKAPDNMLLDLSSRLQTNGQFSQVGKALQDAVQNGNQAKKNAALFTIMQNPEARAFISAEDIEKEE